MELSRVLRFTNRSTFDLTRFVPIRQSLSIKRNYQQEAWRNVNLFTERSHTCGQLTKNDIGKQVTLYGWIKYTRFDNKIIALRDSYGIVQCIVDKKALTKDFRRAAIHNESVVKVRGTVRARPKDQVNKDTSTGDIEVLADHVETINSAKKDLPILTRDSSDHSLNNRLKYRYLDLRGHRMQEALRFRSLLYQIMRQRLCELGFIESETPTLFRRTPGGANEFVVPTQLENKYYALTQSPQQLKQLLMIAGVDRYFQICRCYRDESGRVDRQPEFTQLDIELSFTNQELVMNLVDDLVHNTLSDLNEKSHLTFDIESIFDIEGSIPRLTYQQAMARYGSDKPDTRFGWTIDSNKSGEIKIDLDRNMEDSTLDKSLVDIQTEKKLDTTSFSVRHEVRDNGNSTIIVSNNCPDAHALLGYIRLYVAKELSRRNQMTYDHQFKLLWITDFPLFTQDESGCYEPNHHPFTAPTKDTEHLLETEPLAVIGQHYDLVLNGQEIAGGSIRIHDADLQTQIFETIMRLDTHTFEYFIKALKSGCPPHGGIAFGLDRLIAILLGRDSIRDVIAFPKTNLGRDLMSDSPHDIESSTKKLYQLR